MNTEELGRLVKQQYPVYNKYSDYEIGQRAQAKFSISTFNANGLIAAQEYNIQSRIPKYTSTNFLTILATVLIIGSSLFLFKAWNWNGWEFFIIIILAPVFFIISIYIFQAAYKNRHEAYNFARQQAYDNIDLATRHQDFIKKLQDMAFAEMERGYKTALMAIDLEKLMAQVRNEITVSEAASREFLDPITYLNIKQVQADADVENQKYWKRILFDEHHARELKQMELEARQFEALLAIDMAAIESLLPHQEILILHKQLANMYVELGEIRKLPESQDKTDHLKRVNQQMKAWKSSINGRQKRLV